MRYLYSSISVLSLAQVWHVQAFPMKNTSTPEIVSVPMFVDNVSIAPNIEAHKARRLLLSKRFWFANFSVGASKSLTFLLDTGSADLLLSPGSYNPGPNSQDLHRAVNLSFATTNSDGSGHITVRAFLLTPDFQDS